MGRVIDGDGPPLQGSTGSDPLDLACETARRAGQLLCALRDQRHTVGHKSSEVDLVTEADLASERLIVAAIREHFSEHRILSEEGLGDVLGQVAGVQEGLWLIDPLDGTVNYAHGYAVWSVSMALAVRGQVELGVVYDPSREEMFWARRRSGAWCNGQRLHVSEAARLGESLLATGFPYSRATSSDNNLAEFNALMPRVQGVRRAGSAALDLAHVAAAHLDGYWEKYCNPWDWAAGWLLVEEAGGIVTGMDGALWSLDKNHLAASNGRIHEELLAVLRSVSVQ